MHNLNGKFFITKHELSLVPYPSNVLSDNLLLGSPRNYRKWISGMEECKRDPLFFFTSLFQYCVMCLNIICTFKVSAPIIHKTVPQIILAANLPYNIAIHDFHLNFPNPKLEVANPC